LRQRLYLTAFALHFCFVLAVSVHDVLSDLARGLTWSPPSLEKYWEKGERIAAETIGGSPQNPRLMQGVVTFYLYGAGIESGYGYFAPNVPNSSKVVFELHYGDEHIEYDLPHVSDAAAGPRLISLLDYIGQTDYEPLRQVMLKMLAYSIWQQHPDAITIRAVYGTVNEPTLAAAKRGETESYHFLYAYDFDFRPNQPRPTVP
jgi:hypothetical protein